MQTITDLRSLAQACIDADIHGPEDVLDRDYLASENVGDSVYMEFLRALTPELILRLTAPIVVVNTEKMDLDELNRILEDETSVLEFHPAVELPPTHPMHHLEFTPVEALHSSGPRVYRVGEGAQDQAEVQWRADISGHLDLHGCTTEAQAMRAAKWYHGLYGEVVPGKVGDPYLVTKAVTTEAFSYEMSDTDTVTVNVIIEGDTQVSGLAGKLIECLDNFKAGGQ